MSSIKIIIVEDELIIAEDMKEMLLNMQYEVIGIANGCDEAEQILSRDIPDIALIDINLRGDENGISLAMSIRKRYDIPIIFITSFSDKATVERAKQVKPNGYIVKPFEKEDLYTTIEIALYNFSTGQKPDEQVTKEDSGSVVIRDSIFIRKDYMLVKVRFEDLFWIKSELNYLELHCRGNKHLVRSTLKDFVEKLPVNQFLQVHKSYCINTKCITAIDHGNIWLNDVQIPMGRSYLETVKQKLRVDI